MEWDGLECGVGGRVGGGGGAVLKRRDYRVLSEETRVIISPRASPPFRGRHLLGGRSGSRLGQKRLRITDGGTIKER